MTHTDSQSQPNQQPGAEVSALADDVLALSLRNSPIDATLLGLPGYDEALPEHTEAAEDALRVDIMDALRRIAEAARGPQGPQDLLTLEVLEVAGQAALDRLATRSAEYTITDSFFAPASMLFFSLRMVPIGSPAQASAYLTRLAAVPRVLEDLADRHRQGIAVGRTPVRRLVEAAVSHWDRMLLAGPEHPLRTPVPTPDSGVEQDWFRGEVDRAVREVVDPAVRAYREVLSEEILEHGRPDERPGLCWLPDGAEHYAGLVRGHTTTSRTAEELHRTGLEVIDGLRQRYAQIGGRLFGITELPDIVARLRQDPAMRWRDAEQQLDHAREAIRRAEEAAPQWFGRLPSQRCTVRAVPESEAPGAPAAYYTPPALDGTREGTYWSNTYQAEQHGRYASEAVTFHEAVPGHHFQIAIASELTGLPTLRRLSLFTAYSEGWGLYAEQLAEEMGLYSDDVARLGQLSEDSTRAARLVVDTGLHALGWTRQQVVDFLRANTAMAEQEVQTETDRYIAQPGQALAYMTGRMEIERIRARAQEELGERFDVRAFHDVVLGSGALPLEVLARQVQQWVDEQRA